MSSRGSAGTFQYRRHFGSKVAIPLFITLQRESAMKYVCRLLTCFFTMLFILSCGSGSPAPKAKDLPQGRSETKVVEGASAAGYNGSMMRKKIDKTLDQNDERNKEIEKGANGAPSK
jgi:hypothetical protein